MKHQPINVEATFAKIVDLAVAHDPRAFQLGLSMHMRTAITIATLIATHAPVLSPEPARPLNKPEGARVAAPEKRVNRVSYLKLWSL